MHLFSTKLLLLLVFLLSGKSMTLIVGWKYYWVVNMERSLMYKGLFLFKIRNGHNCKKWLAIMRCKDAYFSFYCEMEMGFYNNEPN